MLIFFPDLCYLLFILTLHFGHSSLRLILRVSHILIVSYFLLSQLLLHFVKSYLLPLFLFSHQLFQLLHLLIWLLDFRFVKLTLFIKAPFLILHFLSCFSIHKRIRELLTVSRFSFYFSFDLSKVLMNEITDVFWKYSVDLKLLI